MSERRGARRAALGAAWLLVLAVGGTDAYLLTQRTVTTAVSFDDALSSFRRSQAAAGQLGRPVGATAPAPASSDTPGGSAATTTTAAPTSVSAAGQAPGVPAKRPPGAGPGQATTTVPPPPKPAASRPYRLPAERVYSYRTSGGESISVASARHDYPARTYSSVRHTGGCNWRAVSDVIEEHRDTTNRCSQPGSLLQTSQSREIEFYGARDGAEQFCDPHAVLHRVGEAVGSIERTVCKDDRSSAKFERTFLGIEQLTVGGVAVQVAHVQIRAELSGRTEGRAFDELWLLETNGLTVRWYRTVDTLADAAFGAKVRYQEEADFVLESITPAT